MTSKPPSEPSKKDAPDVDIDTTIRYTGKCKWFNVLQGFGFLNPDGIDMDVFVHQTEIQMDGFRSLGEGERVSFGIRHNIKGKGGWEAHSVGPEAEGEKLKGSEIRPVGKKKEALIRCYKCGRFGNHVAAKCKQSGLASGIKACYICHSEDHLVDNCPVSKEQKPKRSRREAKKERTPQPGSSKKFHS